MKKFDPSIGKNTQFKSGEKAAKSGHKGGIASGKRRRFAKSVMEALEAEMSKVVDSKSGQYNGCEAIGAALMSKAVRGDIQAARLIFELSGDLNKTKKVEITGKDGAPINVADRKELSVKEAKELLEKIEAEI